jgi:hypothetical protein
MKNQLPFIEKKRESSQPHAFQIMHQGRSFMHALINEMDAILTTLLITTRFFFFFKKPV